MAKQNPIGEAAVQWHVRLTGGKLTKLELCAFESWLQNPPHRAAYDRISHIWEISGPAAHHVRAKWPARQIQARSRRWLIGTFGATAAASGAAVFLAQPWMFASELKTALGERRTFGLDDGSSVTLNSSSALRSRVSNTHRRVLLDHGEALFTVSPDSNHPFMVETAAGNIHVIGTEFSVWSPSPKEIILTVLHGLVAAQPLGQTAPVYIKAGQQFSWTADRVTPVRDIDANKALAWRSGHVVYENANLQDVVEDLERYYGLHARLEDTDAASRPVNGIFQLGARAEFVRAIEIVFKLRISQSGANNAVIHING